MAKEKIVMPQMGESITTGTITRWTKNVGDAIEIDEILLEISTDKVESEIPSPFSGRIEALMFKEGETVDVGLPIAIIETDLSAPVGIIKEEVKSEEKITPRGPETKLPELEKDNRRFFTPLVKSMAKEAGVSLEELDSLKGSGSGGRVNKADFEKYLSTAPRKVLGTSKIPTPVLTQPSSRVEIIPMTNMRKTIAKNMALSKAISPHVNSISQIDMTNIVKFRETIKHDFKKQEGFNLTYTHFIMYALVKALKEFPTVNASIEEDNIVLKKYINLGFATSTDAGLLVPVVKEAEDLNIIGLARKVYELSLKAREKKATLDDLSDGTFTFTNNGSFGTLVATPIILQPQVGIFCAGLIKKELTVMPDESLAIRSIMYGTHTYDHRLVDGAVGGNFLKFVQKFLEETDPATLF